MTTGGGGGYTAKFLINSSYRTPVFHSSFFVFPLSFRNKERGVKFNSVVTFGVGGWEKKSGVPRQRQARGESGRLTSIVLLGLYRLSPRTMGA